MDRFETIRNGDSTSEGNERIALGICSDKAGGEI
jgi:hypothetical protein